MTITACRNGTRLVGEGPCQAQAVYALQVSEMASGQHDQFLWEDLTLMLMMNKQHYFHSLLTDWEIEIKP